MKQEYAQINTDRGSSDSNTFQTPMHADEIQISHKEHREKTISSLEGVLKRILCGQGS